MNVMLITSISNCGAAGKGLQQVMDLFHCRKATQSLTMSATHVS